MLRKHDAVLPQRPIAAFYTARMHDMRWVQTDYSSVLVRLSRLYESKTQAAPPATDWGGVRPVDPEGRSVWNSALSEALRRLGYYARRVNSPLSVPRAP